MTELESQLEKMVKQDVLDRIMNIISKNEQEFLTEISELRDAGFSEEQIKDTIGLDAYENYKQIKMKCQNKYSQLILDEERAKGQINKMW